jgi:hypothetical protein
MAKDKKALKVPKRVAGIKVPKKVRKPVNKALALAENPQARELAVAALTAAAAALGKSSADSARNGDGNGARADLDAVKAQASRLSDLVIAAALDGARRLLDGLDHTPDQAEAERPPEPKRRRSTGRSVPSGSAAGG